MFNWIQIATFLCWPTLLFVQVLQILYIMCLIPPPFFLNTAINSVSFSSPVLLTSVQYTLGIPVFIQMHKNENL